MKDIRMNKSPYELTESEFQVINGFLERNNISSLCGLAENIVLLNDDFQRFFNGLPKAVETLAANGGHGKFIEGLSEICSHLIVFMKMQNSLFDLNILVRALENKAEERMMEQIRKSQSKQAV